MNQLGDKPEEVRKHLEEEKREARHKERRPADADRPDRAGRPRPGEDAHEDTYEEPEDRP